MKKIILEMLFNGLILITGNNIGAFLSGASTLYVNKMLGDAAITKS
jgi:hypothetical protein